MKLKRDKTLKYMRKFNKERRMMADAAPRIMQQLEHFENMTEILIMNFEDKSLVSDYNSVLDDFYQADIEEQQIMQRLCVRYVYDESSKIERYITECDEDKSFTRKLFELVLHDDECNEQKEAILSQMNHILYYSKYDDNIIFEAVSNAKVHNKRLQQDVLKKSITRKITINNNTADLFEEIIKEDLNQNKTSDDVGFYAEAMGKKPEMWSRFCKFMSQEPMVSCTGIGTLWQINQKDNITDEQVAEYYKAVLPNIDVNSENICLNDLHNLVTTSRNIQETNPDDEVIAGLNYDVRTYAYDIANEYGDVELLSLLGTFSSPSDQEKYLKSMVNAIFNSNNPEDVERDYGVIKDFLNSVSVIVNNKEQAQLPSQLIEFYGDKDVIAGNQQTMRWIRRWDNLEEEKSYYKSKDIDKRNCPFKTVKPH